MLLLQAENVSAAVPFSNVTTPKVEDRSFHGIGRALRNALALCGHKNYIG